MKKKFREITIGEKTYGWTIKENTDDNDGSKIINIWYDKQIIHTQKLNEEKSHLL